MGGGRVLKCVVVGDVGESWRVLEGRFEGNQGQQEDTKDEVRQKACPVDVVTPTIGHDPSSNPNPDDPSAVTLFTELRPVSYPGADFVIIGFDPRNDYFEFDRVQTVFAPEIREHLPAVPIVLASGALWLAADWAASPVIVSEERARECADDIGAVFVECEDFGSLEGIAPALRVGRDAALQAGAAGGRSQRGGGGRTGRKCAVM
jgi:hypothetical protein